MVILKSLMAAVFVTFILWFGALLTVGFQPVPFVSTQTFTPLGFMILTTMFFLEFIGFQW